jgi:hypothetical protein
VLFIKHDALLNDGEVVGFLLPSGFFPVDERFETLG